MKANLTEQRLSVLPIKVSNSALLKITCSYTFSQSYIIFWKDLFERWIDRNRDPFFSLPKLLQWPGLGQAKTMNQEYHHPYILWGSSTWFVCCCSPGTLGADWKHRSQNSHEHCDAGFWHCHSTSPSYTFLVWKDLIVSVLQYVNSTHLQALNLLGCLKILPSQE